MGVLLLLLFKCWGIPWPHAASAVSAQSLPVTDWPRPRPRFGTTKERWSSAAMTESMQEKPGALGTAVEAEGRGAPCVDVPEAAKGTRLQPLEDDLWGEDAPQMAEGKWLRHTSPRG